MYRKNTAGQFIGFVAINASTGATMTGTTGFAAFRVLDGTQASATGSVTDKGNGQYSFALSQADTNGNDCSILFTMTGMIAVEKTFIATVLDPTSIAFGLSIAKTTNITGFNDIAATAIVSAGAITTSSGSVSTVGAVTGAVGSVTSAVTVSLAQSLNAARALDTISDTSLTLNDAFQCAIAAATGQKDASSGTNLIISTPHTGTVLRTYTITTTTIPTTVPDKIA